MRMMKATFLVSGRVCLRDSSTSTASARAANAEHCLVVVRVVYV